MVRNEFLASGKAGFALAWAVAIGIFGVVANDLIGVFEPSRSTAKSEVFPVDPGAVAAVIAGGHLFGISESPEASPQENANISLVLQAVVTGTPDQPGWAVIAVDGGEQTGFVELEEIAPGVTLAKVAADHVVLEMGGSSRDLFFAGDSGAAGRNDR